MAITFARLMPVLLTAARAGHANPMVLLDELEKAGGTGGGNRIDGIGRLWDCLLGMLETETSFRYPDPFFQKNVDLSQISYLATANSVAALPRPLLDRFRVLELALPSRDHLDALLPRAMSLIIVLPPARCIHKILLARGSVMARLAPAESGSLQRRWRRLGLMRTIGRASASNTR